MDLERINRKIRMDLALAEALKTIENPNNVGGVPRMVTENQWAIKKVRAEEEPLRVKRCAQTKVEDSLSFMLFISPVV